MWSRVTLCLLAPLAVAARPWDGLGFRRMVRESTEPTGMNYTGPQCGDNAVYCVDMMDLITTGLAREYCVNVVLTNRTFESANATDLQVGGMIVPFEVDVTDNVVTLNVPGAPKPGVTRIVEGFGCQQVFDELITPRLVNMSAGDADGTDGTSSTVELYVSDFVWPEALEGTDTAMEGVNYKALREILDKELNFLANETYVGSARTKSVLVVYKGAIVAEGYADWLNITAETPLVGWSMTKTLTSAMVGLRAADGKIDVDEVAENAFWTEQEKDTRNITIKNLMQMTSGIEWAEDYGPVTDVTRMLYTTPNAPAYVARRDQAKIPGTHFYYSSGNTNLVQHALRLSFNDDGGDDAYWSYAKTRLFDPIGAKSFVLMPDALGTFVGSSYSVATTRDWARAGLLYVNNGMWDGRVVLTPEWVNYTTTGTAVSGGRYAAGVYAFPVGEEALGPSPAYYMSGYGGQIVAGIPSKELVVVHMGYNIDFPEANGPDFVRSIASLFPVSE